MRDCRAIQQISKSFAGRSHSIWNDAQSYQNRTPTPPPLGYTATLQFATGDGKMPEIIVKDPWLNALGGSWFRDSSTWSCMSPNMSYKYSCPTHNPTHNYPHPPTMLLDSFFFFSRVSLFKPTLLFLRVALMGVCKGVYEFLHGFLAGLYGILIGLCAV